jgi:hypothetical protein
MRKNKHKQEDIMTTFLPAGDENLVKEKGYIKPTELVKGSGRFRIVQPIIGGWVEWVNNKPVRYSASNKQPKPIVKGGKVLPFWACYIWVYDTNSLKVAEFSQQSILQSLRKVATDKARGDIKKYDLVLKTHGLGYAVEAAQESALSKDITSALQEKPAVLEALYDGKDPWATAQGMGASKIHPIGAAV